MKVFEVPATIVPDAERFQLQSLRWANQFPYSCFLDSNSYSNLRYDWLLAVGSSSLIDHREPGQAFAALQAAYDQQAGHWLFGFLSYDLKNELEPGLYSNNPNPPKFPLLHFFRPDVVLASEKGQLMLYTFDEVVPQQVLSAIEASKSTIEPARDIPPMQARITRGEYLQTINTIREHIAAGDLYEMNFCQEFYSQPAHLDPLALFMQLNERSRSPFAAYYRANDQHLLCASPERFLQKQGSVLRSQPIKGTAARHPNPVADEQQREALRASIKDRAEHVMIVDLVRNDLARSCLPGSVQVEELFGLYPFPQVWQMISTIRGELRPEVHPIQALANAFPMGSMTGAPKRMAMQLIEQYETMSRGLYSGTVGYINPEGDFDFNVVIRSLIYQSSAKYLSVQVGGAIVYDSDPEAEYEECLLKASAIRGLLGEE